MYHLRNDLRYIADVQRATRETEDYGIAPTHGLFGSRRWWDGIETGELPLNTVRGRITAVYMAGHNDYPMFSMETDSGEQREWARYLDAPELDRLYEIGRPVEVVHVIQRHRLRSRPAAETECVVEIRIGAATGVEADRDA